MVFYISEDPLSASFTHFLEKYYFSVPLQLTLTLWPKCFHISNQFSRLGLFFVMSSTVDSNCSQLNIAKDRKDTTFKNRIQTSHISFSHTPLPEPQEESISQWRYSWIIIFWFFLPLIMSDHVFLSRTICFLELTESLLSKLSVVEVPHCLLSLSLNYSDYHLLLLLYCIFHYGYHSENSIIWRMLSKL